MILVKANDYSLTLTLWVPGNRWIQIEQSETGVHYYRLDSNGWDTTAHLLLASRLVAQMYTFCLSNRQRQLCSSGGWVFTHFF